MTNFRVIALVNSKGGVGKTTTTIGLAQALSQKGTTLVADLDPQGSATSWAINAANESAPLKAVVAQIGIEHRPAAIPRLVSKAAEEAQAEWLIVDTSPADLDRADAAIEIATAANGLVLVPTKTAALDLPRALVTLEDVGERADSAVLLTMTRTGTNRLKEAREALQEAGVDVLKSHIPLREHIAGAAELTGTDMNTLEISHKGLADEIDERLNR